MELIKHTAAIKTILYIHGYEYQISLHFRVRCYEEIVALSHCDCVIHFFFFFFFFRLLPFRGRHSGCVSNIRTEDLAVFYAYARCPSWRNLLLIVGNLARPFNVLGCTLEGNQLRHCAAKPIVQLAIIANTSGFLHQSCFDPVTNRLWVGRTTHWATGAHWLRYTHCH